MQQQWSKTIQGSNKQSDKRQADQGPRQPFSQMQQREIQKREYRLATCAVWAQRIQAQIFRARLDHGCSAYCEQSRWTPRSLYRHVFPWGWMYVIQILFPHYKFTGNTPDARLQLLLNILCSVPGAAYLFFYIHVQRMAAD